MTELKGAIIQPSFLPWRGFFDIIHRSDVFVYLDDVQFDKHSWRNRNVIRTSAGVQWITVPVLTSGKFGQKILETQIRKDNGWREKILHAIYYNYRKSNYFEDYYPFLKSALSGDWNLISDLDIYLIERIMDILGSKRKTFRSSALCLKATEKNERVIEICQKVGIKHYISGPTTRDYMQDGLYKQNGISVEYMDYNYPPYKQLYEGFEPNVSVIDLLFSVGLNSHKYIWDLQ